MTVSVEGSQLGGSVIFGCMNGYKLTGAHIIVCQKNGKWDKPPPKCTFTGGRKSVLGSGAGSVMGVELGQYWGGGVRSEMGVGARSEIGGRVELGQK